MNIARVSVSLPAKNGSNGAIKPKSLLPKTDRNGTKETVGGSGNEIFSSEYSLLYSIFHREKSWITIRLELQVVEVLFYRLFLFYFISFGVRVVVCHEEKNNWLIWGYTEIVPVTQIGTVYWNPTTTNLTTSTNNSHKLLWLLWLT